MQWLKNTDKSYKESMIKNLKKQLKLNQNLNKWKLI